MPIRAVHADTGADHVLSWSVPEETIEVWRKLGREGALVCPACKTEMRVAAGEVREPYFAHWHRRDCPAPNDTAEQRAARAVLHDWLAPTFGDALTVEHWDPDEGLPRQIDLVVRLKGKPWDVAVWIHDREMRRVSAREELRDTFRQLGYETTWVFTPSMHRPGERDGEVNLTTTERDFLDRTRYGKDHYRGLGSLHYLTEGLAGIRTYRGVELCHPPGGHVGIVYETPFAGLRLAKHGEIVHPEDLERREESTRGVDTPRPPLYVPSSGLADGIQRDPLADGPSVGACVCDVCGSKSEDCVERYGSSTYGKCRSCASAFGVIA